MNSVCNYQTDIHTSAQIILQVPISHGVESNSAPNHHCIVTTHSVATLDRILARTQLFLLKTLHTHPVIRDPSKP